MDILKSLNKRFSIESFDAPSSESSIKEMSEKAPIQIPHEYTEIIRKSSELEIIISGEKVLRIWGANGCIEMNEAYNIQKYLPHAWAIGDDEGGHAIVYAKEKDSIGVYAVSFSDLDDKEKLFITPSLYDFLVNGTGADLFASL